MSGLTTIRLADGRDLELYVSGPADAVPLIYHHGTPSAAIAPATLERAVHAAGLRFVTYSRPGYRRSSRLPGRTVVHAVDDAASILDHLGASRSVAMSWSSGGPHALATAALMPQRVVGVAVISSIAPDGQPDLEWTDGQGEQNAAAHVLARQGEDALRPFLEEDMASMAHADRASILEVLPTLISGSDRAVLNEEIGGYVVDNMLVGAHDGFDGTLDDLLSFARPWGFDISAISVPVAVWHGDSDLMVPFAHGTWLAKHIPTARSHWMFHEGHLSLYVHHVEEMVAELVAML